MASSTPPWSPSPHPIVAAVAERRRALGISQVALAQRSGTGQSAVCAIETGAVCNPRLWTVVRLAAALGCDIDFTLRPREVA